uniref:Uncharacterized protein n=1 Tax=Heterorhabditis bacteriophora TaxID=37862 RepID=A0A1I7WBI4_HETBA
MLNCIWNYVSVFKKKFSIPKLDFTFSENSIIRFVLLILLHKFILKATIDQLQETLRSMFQIEKCYQQIFHSERRIDLLDGTVEEAALLILIFNLDKFIIFENKYFIKIYYIANEYLMNFSLLILLYYVIYFRIIRWLQKFESFFSKLQFYFHNIQNVRCRTLTSNSSYCEIQHPHLVQSILICMLQQHSSPAGTRRKYGVEHAVFHGSSYSNYFVRLYLSLNRFNFCNHLIYQKFIPVISHFLYG